MSLRIFDNTRPVVTETVGTLRSGQQINGKPISLETWRFTSSDPEVLKAVADAFGGTAQAWNTTGKEGFEVLTNEAVLDVVLEWIGSEMILWGRNGPIRKCDGIQQKDDACSACVCPATMDERKKAADQGTGCEPNVTVKFRLVGLESLGVFRFFSSSWGFAKDVQAVEEELGRLGGRALATLTKRTVNTKDGRTFQVPEVTITGPAPAEEEPF